MEVNTNGTTKRQRDKWEIPLGDLERALNRHRGKPGHQALQKSSFPGNAFSNRDGPVNSKVEANE
jgi:hypothetical protein